MQRRDDFARRAFALHFHGKKQDVHIREAPLQNTQDVADGRAGGRSDHADPLWQHRQLLLALLIEQTCFSEPLFQLFECKLQRAQANRLDVAHVNLIFTARLVHAERTAHGDLQPIFGAEFQAADLIAEADAANLRACVFQSEIEMPGLRGVIVRHFALDPHIAERGFEDFADALGELADFPDVALGNQIEKVGLAHRIIVAASSAKKADDPEEKSKHQTHNQAGHDWKVEAGIATLIDDVAGQAAQSERKLRAENEQRTDADKHDAENQQHSPEFTQWVHANGNRRSFYPSHGAKSRARIR